MQEGASVNCRETTCRIFRWSGEKQCIEYGCKTPQPQMCPFSRVQSLWAEHFQCHS